jgi:hypothetical protein
MKEHIDMVTLKQRQLAWQAFTPLPRQPRQ